LTWTGDHSSHADTCDMCILSFLFPCDEYSTWKIISTTPLFYDKKKAAWYIAPAVSRNLNMTLL
jgi:hypothetical protein